jgi:UDP-N-acetylglucosamine 4,6-dehydratase/5-epimerase
MPTILITGATGTLGHALIPTLLEAGDEVVVFSRDEFKQLRMRQQYGATNVKYVVGDVRDQAALSDACQGVDALIHAAALKQVPVGEEQPYEVQHTNIMGSHNAVRAVMRSPTAKACLLIGSDKAVRAATAYGASKLLAERIFSTAGEEARRLPTHRRKVYATVRYGNVLGSRGSVLDVWRELVDGEEPLVLTDPTMTRFWQTPQQAAVLVQMVMECMQSEPELSSGLTFVKLLPASNIAALMSAVLGVLGKDGSYPVVTLGPRPAEKRDEELIHEGEGPHVVQTPSGSLESSIKAMADIVSIRPGGEADPHAKYLRYWSGDPRQVLTTKELEPMVKEAIGFLDEWM